MSESDDPLDQLLREAGPPPGPDAETLERLRAHTHAQWRAQIMTRRRLRTRTWALAASIVLALAVVLPLSMRTPRPEIVAQLIHPANAMPDATIERSSGAVRGLAADTMAVGDVLSVGTRAVALRLQGGDAPAAVRLDAGTHIRWQGRHEFELLAGRVYVDSGDAARAPSAALQITAGQARVRHVGTQYVTTRDGQAVRVVVREGRVRIDVAGQAAQIERGQAAAFATDGGAIRSGSASLTGTDWTWAEELAPRIDLEGRDLHSVLIELARETGRPLRFASVDAERQARATILHGPALDLPPAVALQTLLATSGFAAVPDTTTELVIAVR